MKNQVSISLVTTCKGRLNYLKKVLPSWLKLDYDNYDIIIVDYDDPDGTEEYIKKNKKLVLKDSKAKEIKVVKVKNKPFFNLNDARNRGIEVSESELIFMIDSDIKFKKRNLLKKINREYKEGILFWSNLPVFNTNYKEIVEYYLLDFQVEIKHPSILPFIPIKRGITGTACFSKRYWNQCGKYDMEINKEGYGFDDREFYLRYLNYVYYNSYMNKIKKGELYYKKLDEFIKLTSVFDLEYFYEVPNTVFERGRFYSKGQRDSNVGNKIYISEFFKKFFEKIKYDEKIKLNKSEFDTTLKSVIKSEFAKQNNWFLPFFFYIYASRKWGRKDIKEAVLLFKKSIELNVFNNPFFKSMKIKSLNNLYYLKKYGEGVKDKKYLKSIINEILLLKRKKEEEYKILINAYFEINDYENFIKYSKIALKKKSFDLDFKFSVMFNLAAVYNETNQDKRYFIKALNLLEKLPKDMINLYRKASIYEKLEKYEKALKLFNNLLETHSHSDSFKANIYFHMGEIHYNLNNTKSAKMYFSKALELNPYHQKAKKYYNKLSEKMPES